MKPRRIQGIDCKGESHAGIRKALLERFEEMSGLRSSAVMWKDPEGVHSMRVASRRLRSALSDFGPYINKRALSSPIKQIREIAGALGEVRDQDVAILELVQLASKAPPPYSKTLKQLVTKRKDIRRNARQDLKEVLQKDRLKELSAEFENGITSATTERDKTGDSSDEAQRPYEDVARLVILSRLKELEQLSNSLYQPLDVKPLHEMRIAAKRLRYAIELFGTCWPAKILTFAKRAADLQSSLGRLHDCDVWIESLGKDIVDSGKLEPGTEKEALIWLYTHFNESRDANLRESVALWNEWETLKLSEKLKKILDNSHA